MKIKKLELRNYKRFAGKHIVEFEDTPIAVIFGYNGTGKTSILDAVAIILEVFTSKMIGIEKEIAFEFEDVTINQEEALISGVFQSHYEAEYSSATISIERNIASPVTFYDKTTDSLLNQLKKRFWQEQNESSPVFIYYRTNRHVVGKGVQDYILTNKGFNRKEAYNNAFGVNIDYNQILIWYIQQINIQNNEVVKRQDLTYELPSLKAITDAINIFLSSLEGCSLGNVTLDSNSYFNNNLELFLYKDQVKLAFHQLSAGEKMVIGIVLDIAYRMSIANTHLENPLESKGIILIDEIELHLHPKWQSSVLGALSATFPNIQFIATTHSPLVINQLKGEQLILLDDQRIVQGKSIHNTYGRDINSILEDFMGANERPAEIKKLIEEIEELLDEEQPNIQLANNKLNVLKSLVGPNDYEIVKLEALIALEEDEEDY
ncbi:MAG: AAA family ATPase [Bacteroidota bacterium]